MVDNQQRFDQAIRLIDQVNQQDPRQVSYQGQLYPKELLYSQRMSQWLTKLEPRASEALQLAARSQHIGRWRSPREHYPMDRKGYLLWRGDLKRFHAQKAAEILSECGYEEDTIDKVQDLILKKSIKTDPDSQLLEDVVCLVFLENYFADFSSKHEKKKVVRILKKTWKKMSRRGHQMALRLDLPAAAHKLLEEAVEV